MTQQPSTQKSWLIQQATLAIVLCGLIGLLVGYYHFILTSKLSNVQNVFALLSEYPSCTSWYGKVSIPSGSICIHQYPDKDLFTNSDVEFWNFGRKKWEGGTSTGDPSTVEILRSMPDETGKSSPLMMRCTWGCSVGLYEDYQKEL